jgi:hypothetical protein
LIDADGGVVVTGLSKSEAEDLLDWLEVHGCRQVRLSHADDSGFVVRYS